MSRNANSDAVNRAYKRKLAENRGDEAVLARIEEAHSAIMMTQLTARLQARYALAPIACMRLLQYTSISKLKSVSHANAGRCISGEGY